MAEPTVFSYFKGMKLILSLVALVFIAIPSVAADVLDVVELFHDPGDPIRVGIEVEFKGLTVQQSIEILKKVLGGRVQYSDMPWDLLIEEADGTLSKKVINLRPGVLLHNATGGPLLVKPEHNDTSGVISAIDVEKNVVIELLTSPGPIRYPGVVELQKALWALKAHGAQGTRADLPVSLQVNVEIAGGDPQKIRAMDIVNLLRNYMRPEHHQQIRKRLNIPPIRHTYIQPVSQGFLRRLMDPAYNPTLEQLKDDAIYRQLHELLGDVDRAWSAPIEELRKDLLDHIERENAFDSKDSPLFRVIKFSPLKVASLLLYAFPRDPMARLVTEHQWIKLIPAIEFRERNNDFDVISAVKQAVGFVRASERVGAFVYDPQSPGQLTPHPLPQNLSVQCHALFARVP